MVTFTALKQYAFVYTINLSCSAHEKANREREDDLGAKKKEKEDKEKKREEMKKMFEEEKQRRKDEKERMKVEKEKVRYD